METLKRDKNPIRMRNYGRILQQMVQVASEETDETTRHRMIVYIARCMRQKNVIWNKDQDPGINRVKEDIYRLSNGKLECDYPTFDQEMQRGTGSKSEKKKKV